MHADERDQINVLAEMVIGAAFEVSNNLGIGFLEKVYENALFHELRLRGLAVEQQVHVPVNYKGAVVGDYIVDMWVDRKLIVEIKCAEAFASGHLAQCLNYLKIVDGHLSLLLNFQKTRVEIKRVVRAF